MNSQIVTRSSSNTFERIMASLPGWMLILAGASMVAMVMLVPAWIDCLKLDWQHQVVQTQSRQLLEQQVAYEQFLTALRENDPVAVERMAYYHLRQKPAGMAMIDQIHAMNASGQTHRIWQTMPTIEDLLAKPVLQLSQACPPGVIPESRLVRIATGPHRYLVLGFGVLCLFAGLLPPSRQTLAALALAGAAIANPEVDEGASDWADEQATDVALAEEDTPDDDIMAASQEETSDATPDTDGDVPEPVATTPIEAADASVGPAMPIVHEEVEASVEVPPASADVAEEDEHDLIVAELDEADSAATPST